MSLELIIGLAMLAVALSLLSRNPSQSEMDHEAHMAENAQAQHDMARAEAEAKRHQREEMLRQAQLRKAQIDSRHSSAEAQAEIS